ncbi:signal peptidase II [Salinarimonas ramus]|uniref:Lipoprotein signal peptidase n=1 Tax=Salinarimonas ramus TaxID=690164 RepID=A0A917QAB6_9HYPH|nr:signal peptidase II [Salinarimonas ramus]GGK39378.1 lipoprotein signal peptidase [Salinarimonas ramus]
MPSDAAEAAPNPPKPNPPKPIPPAHARFAIALALAIFLADQATKLYFLFGYDLRVHAPLVLAPFAELIVVWNRGISYGLFQQETELGRWLLVALSIGASIGLGLWMLRTPARFLAGSLALVVGGALGNVVDRVAYGAVFDFVHLHWGAFSWYVFNVADAAIVAGVLGLLYDSLVLEPRRARREGPPHESRDGG